MAEKPAESKPVAPIIVVKKKKHDDHPPHGGAWKVAYADFVTAMMCFFLVMWLMGSDEETKQAIEHYFNNPSAPPLAWRPELAKKDVVPLGVMTGAGDNVVNGAEGRAPAEFVQNPNMPPFQKEMGHEPAISMDTLFEDDDLMNLDLLKFSIPENELFLAGSADQWSPKAEKVLEKLGRLALHYHGAIIIQAFYDNSLGDPERTFEFQTARVVAVKNTLVNHVWASEDRVATPVVPAPKSADGNSQPLKLEFTLHKN